MSKYEGGLRFDRYPIFRTAKISELAETVLQRAHELQPVTRGANRNERDKDLRRLAQYLISAMYSSNVALDGEANPVAYPVKPTEYGRDKPGRIRESARHVLLIVEALMDLGWVKRFTGEFNRGFSGIEPKGQLLDSFSDLGLQWHPQHTIPQSHLLVLRDVKRDHKGKIIRHETRGKRKTKTVKYEVAIADTETTLEHRAQLEAINKALCEHCFTIGLSDDQLVALKAALIEKDKRRKNKEPAELNLHKVQMTRIFARGSLEKGGRFYSGWWQGMPKTFRQYIRINCQPTVELDYGSMDPRLMYWRLGRPFDEYMDPYDIGLPGWTGGDDPRRDIIKEIINALVNDEDRRYFVSEDKLEALGVTQQQLDKHIDDTHPGFFDAIGNGAGLRAQYDDAQIAQSVIFKMIEKGTIALPIHDSFIVPETYEAELRKAMRDSFYEYTGTYAPVDKVNHGERINEGISQGILKYEQSWKDYMNELKDCS